jgi:iron complex outermembrane receptor protein
MQVLVDGRSVYDPVFGGMIWESIPLSIADVERIEVVRGPNAASYGANAFLGAINIITRKPVLSGETRARVVVGSQETRYVDLAQDWGFGSGHAFQLSAGLADNDGFDDIHDGGRLLRLNARLDLRLNPRDRLELFAGASKTDLEAGFPLDPVQPERDVALAYSYQQLRYQRNLDDGSDLSFQLYHNRQERDDRYDVMFVPHWPVIPVYVDTSFIADRTDAELEWRTQIGPATRLVLGSGWRLDKGEAPGGLDPAADTSHQQFRLFGHGEHRLMEDWLLQGGLMVEHFDGLGTYTSPRLSLNHSYHPQHTLRISAARGYRLPSLLEQHFLFGLYSALDDSPFPYPNGSMAYSAGPDIEPERIDAFEIGLVGDLSGLHLNYDIKLFKHRIRNLIDAEKHVDTLTVPGTEIVSWVTGNVGQMDLHGLEMQLTARPGNRTRAHLAYSLAWPDGQSWVDYLNGVQTGPRDLDNLVPRHTVGLLIRHDFGAGISGSANFIHVSEQTWAGDGGNLPDFNRLDLKLAKAMRIPGADLRLELILHNALNDRYNDFLEPEDNHPGNVFDRRLYGQLIVRGR